MSSLHWSETQRFNASNHEPPFEHEVMGFMFHRVCHAPICPRATVLLVALAWSTLGFGEEIPATSEASSDQIRLATLALESPDYKIRKDAVNELTDQTLLARIALESHETGIVLAALSNVTNRTVLAKIAGDMATINFRAPEAAARVCLALQDPTIMDRMPDSHAYFSWQHIDQDYEGGLSKDGESIHFAIKQGSETCAEDYWASVFPSDINATYYNHSFRPDHAFLTAIPARVDIATMLVKLFSQPRFTSEDVLKLASSQVPEVRAGALSRVMDEALLEKVGAQDTNADVRQVAEQCLTELRSGAVPAALHNVKLSGIMSFSGKKQALFTIRPAVEPGKPLGKPVPVELEEDQGNGLLEVLEIHSNEGVVKIKFDGQIYTITPKGEIARVRALK